MKFQEVVRSENKDNIYQLLIRGENTTKDKTFNLKLIKGITTIMLIDTTKLVSVDEVASWIDIVDGEYTLLDTEKEQQHREIINCYNVLHRLEKEVDLFYTDSVNDVKEIVNDMLYEL